MTNGEMLDEMLRKTFPRTIFIRGKNELWGTQSIVFSDEWLKMPSVQPEPCEDAISRRAALECFEMTNTRPGAKHAIETLPSVQPEIIRCHQCKYAEVADSEDSQDGYTCQFHRGSIWFSGSYCSWAERRQNGN